MLWELKPENEEEILAVNDLLLKMREEKQRQELIQKFKMTISLEVSNAVNKIGLAETKIIIREINRKLKELAED